MFACPFSAVKNPAVNEVGFGFCVVDIKFSVIEMFGRCYKDI
jgi:hypothetical protein